MRMMGVRCSCGWIGSGWPAAKDHIVAAMQANELLDEPVPHEVRPLVRAQDQMPFNEPMDDPA